jgi:Ras-related protein Rab-1A
MRSFSVRTQQQPMRLFKIVIVGDTAVGKSSLLLRFADDAFTESYISTIGVDFRFKQMDVNGVVVKLQMWDTAGQERFRTITSAYYRAADGIIVVYDVCSRASFDQIPAWMGELVKHDARDLPVLLIGNKSDRRDRVVRTEEGRALATQLGINLFSETSAKSGEQVEVAFRALSSAMMQRASVAIGAADGTGSDASASVVRISGGGRGAGSSTSGSTCAEGSGNGGSC